MRHMRPRSLALAATILWLAALVGCSTTEPDGEITDEARMEALELTADALRTDRALETAREVEMLTNGFAEGLADDSAGLNVELGSEIQGLNGQEIAAATIGSRLQLTTRHRDEIHSQLMNPSVAKADPQPGDLLFRYEEINLDGSVTVVSVYQGDPAAVVLVEFETTWPPRNLILHSAKESAEIDRGADWDTDADDTWLSYHGEVVFRNSAKLERWIERENQGGIADGDQVEITSVFTPRPLHPVLNEIRTKLVADLGDLETEVDDRFLSAERTITFKGISHDGRNPRIEESFISETPLAEGEEPCGGELSRAVYFRSDRRLSQWTDEAQWSCSGGGQLSRDIRFADGSRASVQLTQLPSGVVQLDALERDGTRTLGTFDEANGRFDISTNYPAGHDPVARDVAGQTVGENSWQLDESIEYADGFVETNHLEGTDTATSWQLSGFHQGRDESLSFGFTKTLEEMSVRVVGHVENDRDQSLDFAVEEFDDGSRVVEFTAIDGELTVHGMLVVDAEGCGKGSLEIIEGSNRVTIEVEFCDEVLVDDDAGLSVDL